jgi:NDP-sugar pyrophosphorylase family protein
MLKIIVPLAGSSDVYLSEGYLYPKPLIEIRNKLMIEHALENPSKLEVEHEFIFIIKNEDALKYHLDNTLKLLVPNCSIIKLKNTTKGALCSVLMAIDKINENDKLLIINGDQVINFDFNVFHKTWEDNCVDSGIVIFESIHPRWSYAKLSEDIVIQTAEKNPISKNAIAGYYYFKRAEDFIKASFDVVLNDDNYEGNYYISSVINQYILRGKINLVHRINASNYFSFYSPKLLNEFV